MPNARAVLLAGALAAAAPAGAQPLADRVARAGDGAVRFAYAVREGVCGDGGRSVSITGADGTSRYGEYVDYRRGGDGDGWDAWCAPGPARVTLTVRGGVPQAVRLAVGGRAGGAAPERLTDLGAVPAAEAASYLLALAGRADAPSPGRALLAAVVADSVVLWPRLLGLARDERAATAARREAGFWAGQAACDAVVRARGPVAPGDTAEREVRKQVVFALSQRPAEERRTALARVARADRDPAVRCAALFWLGQGRGGREADAPVLALYEAVLRADAPR